MSRSNFNTTAPIAVTLDLYVADVRLAASDRADTTVEVRPSDPGKAADVILVDDLIATGGTAEGAVKLLRRIGAEVLAACFIVDLPELGGADKLRKLDVPVRTLVSFEGH